MTRPESPSGGLPSQRRDPKAGEERNQQEFGRKQTDENTDPVEDLPQYHFLLLSLPGIESFMIKRLRGTTRISVLLSRTNPLGAIPVHTAPGTGILPVVGT